ncbi:TetR/AcrR family transcriptional regulator [Dactylosporangium sp. AC04546]|uniref:TetR/AcrR family transcriptional regulator n=1 Tax=Dactylosporangium sp. AC04546 TaxID=2862460 RepID=UPI001EE006EA|nr:TetR/AcrR family transcriptional regulator [Dactylosporangium sp. AC04546]WVK79416.1 TetR/AcrR family transcriptional regulator [Dactylosporangium sp. AC04546]
MEDNRSYRAMLDRVLAYAAAEGLTGRSLREIAAGVGTSHRMLIYHFGSRDGVLAAVVNQIEQQQRDLLGSLTAQVRSAGTGPGGVTGADLMLTLWAQVADPQLRPYVRLFYEVVGVAVHGTPGTEHFFDSLTEPWLRQAEDTADDLSLDVDRAALRLGVAVSRGLLLELVAGADPDEVDASYRLFVEMWQQTGDRRRTQ